MASKMFAGIAKVWRFPITGAAGHVFLLIFALQPAIGFAAVVLWAWLTTDVTLPAWLLCLAIAAFLLLPVAIIVATVRLLRRDPPPLDHSKREEHKKTKRNK